VGGDQEISLKKKKLVGQKPGGIQEKEGKKRPERGGAATPRIPISIKEIRKKGVN